MKTKIKICVLTGVLLAAIIVRAPAAELRVVVTRLGDPRDLCAFSNGELLVAEWDKGIVTRVYQSGATETAIEGLSGPWGLACGDDGGFWVSELRAGKVHKIDPETGTKSSYEITNPFDLEAGRNGVLFVAAGALYRIRPGYDPEIFYRGPGVIRFVALDPGGQFIYAAMSAGSKYKIEKIDAETGKFISTVAFRLDYQIGGIEADAEGNVYISESDLGKVAGIKPDGKIETVVENLATTRGLALDADLNLYIAVSAKEPFTIPGLDPVGTILSDMNVSPPVIVPTNESILSSSTPKGNEKAVISWLQWRDGAVTVKIIRMGEDESGYPVAILTENEQFTDGRWFLEWDGTDFGGRIVDPGTYRVILVAISNDKAELFQGDVTVQRQSPDLPFVELVAPGDGAYLNSPTLLQWAPESDAIRYYVTVVRLGFNSGDKESESTSYSISEFWDQMREGEYVWSVRGLFPGMMEGPDSTRRFTKDITPPVIAHTPAARRPAGSNVEAACGVSDNFGLASAPQGGKKVAITFRFADNPEQTQTIPNLSGSIFRTAIPVITSVPGTFRYFITAEDLAGNVSRLPQSGYFEVEIYIPDTTGPLITNLIPANGSTVETFRPLIGAKVTDAESAVDPASISLKLDGQAVHAAFDPGSGTVSFTPAQDLSEAVHTVLLSAADTSGNSSSAAWSFSVNVDTTGPEITDFTPAQGSVVISPQPEISATVSDPSGIDSGSIQITLNGAGYPAVFNSGTGQVRVNLAADLDDAPVVVVLAVSDQKGNQSTASWTFTVRADTADIIAIAKPVFDPDEMNFSVTFDRQFTAPPALYLHTQELVRVPGYPDPRLMPAQGWSPYQEGFQTADLPLGWDTETSGDAHINIGGGVFMSAEIPFGNAAQNSDAAQNFYRPTWNSSSGSIEFVVQINDFDVNAGGVVHIRAGLSWQEGDEYKSLSFFWAAVRMGDGTTQYAQVVQYNDGIVITNPVVLTRGRPYRITFRNTGGRLSLEVDGETIASGLSLGGPLAGFGAGVNASHDLIPGLVGAASIQAQWISVSADSGFYPDFTANAAPLRYQGTDYDDTQFGNGSLWATTFGAISQIAAGQDAAIGPVDITKNINAALVYIPDMDAYVTFYTDMDLPGFNMYVLGDGGMELKLWINRIFLSQGDGAYLWNPSALDELSWTGYLMTDAGGGTYSLNAQGSFLDSGFYIRDPNGIYYWADPPDSEQAGSDLDSALGDTITFQGGAGRIAASEDRNPEQSAALAVTGAHNYPNPFDSIRERTKIRYELSRDADVNIKIYTETGSRVADLGPFNAGFSGGTAGVNEIEWDGTDNNGNRMPNGGYIAYVQAVDGALSFRAKIKIAVLKR